MQQKDQKKWTKIADGSFIPSAIFHIERQCSLYLVKISCFKKKRCRKFTAFEKCLFSKRTLDFV